MAQLDVHLNPGPLRGTVPMVVVVQSSLFDGYRRRVVVPLVLRSGWCCARWTWWPTTSWARRGQPERTRPGIPDALNEMLTRSWG